MQPLVLGSWPDAYFLSVVSPGMQLPWDLGLEKFLLVTDSVCV